jgi:hypothetical protein
MALGGVWVPITLLASPSRVLSASVILVLGLAIQSAALGRPHRRAVPKGPGLLYGLVARRNQTRREMIR